LEAFLLFFYFFVRLIPCLCSQFVNLIFDFLSRDMFCAGRVVEDDLKRTMHACGGSIQSTVTNLSVDALGTCELFEERQIGGERFFKLVLFGR